MESHLEIPDISSVGNNFTMGNVCSCFKREDKNEEAGIIENMEEGNVENEILEENLEDFQNEEVLQDAVNLPVPDLEVNQLAIYLAAIDNQDFGSLDPTPGFFPIFGYTPDGEGCLHLIVTKILYYKPDEPIVGNCDTMVKDSYLIAEVYIRTHLIELGIDFSRTCHFFGHIYPSDAPKTGYSAGCALVTSMLSAIKQRGVSLNIGFFGEIGEDGRVIVVGGEAAKIKAAVRAKMQTIIAPRLMQPAIERTDILYRSQLQFIYIDYFVEALPILFPN
uniref:Lon proteolytic domain-containing protein n=1 Tax=Meloidogyne incognita TaxID=6306 RepID=A0A914KWP4_MELIC